jgi:septal ring factor EnvC (AmiA/AmiB activator)
MSHNNEQYRPAEFQDPLDKIGAALSELSFDLIRIGKRLHKLEQQFNRVLCKLEHYENAQEIVEDQLRRQREWILTAPQGTNGNPPLDLPPDPEEIEGGM